MADGIYAALSGAITLSSDTRSTLGFASETPAKGKFLANESVAETSRPITAFVAINDAINVLCFMLCVLFSLPRTLRERLGQQTSSLFQMDDAKVKNE